MSHLSYMSSDPFELNDNVSILDYILFDFLIAILFCLVFLTAKNEKR